MARIPIRYLNRDGEENGAYPRRDPVVRANIRYDPDADRNPGRRTGIFKTVQAQVDTGAQGCLADTALLNALGCPVLGGASVTGVTGGSRAAIHKAHVLLPPSEVQISVEVHAIENLSQGRPYQLILGTPVLGLGKLHLDFPGEDFYFEIADEFS